MDTAPAPHAPRLLVLEDDPAIAEALVYALRADGFAVQHVALVRDALAALTTTAPDAPFDLAIFDVGLPDGNGFDLCRTLRKTSALPVVFLTARSDEIDRILGLELGADDYVAKPFSPREVCARVRAILRRIDLARASMPNAAQRPTPRPAPHAAPDPTPSAATLGDWQLDEAAQRIHLRGYTLALTRYEYLLLATLMRRPGRIYSRSQLMDTVWADAPQSSDRTVDAHIKLLRGKLRALGAEGCIQTHRHMGYAFSPDATSA